MGLRKENGNTILAKYDGTESSVQIPNFIYGIDVYTFDGNSTANVIRIHTNARIINCSSGAS